MSTLFKILRSITTSLLFLIIVLIVMIQASFTYIELNGTNLPSAIDREELKNQLIEENIEDPAIEEIAEEYLTDYINYIFHKRSYPSLQTINFADIKEENLAHAKSIISNMSEKIGLDYEHVVLLRNVNNVISNGSIHLLIDVAIFFLFIILAIEQMSFKRSAKLFSGALIITSTILMILLSIAPTLLTKIENIEFRKILSSIFTDTFLSNSFFITLAYFGAGVLILAGILIFDKYIAKKLS